MPETKHTAGPWHVELGKGSYRRPALVLAGKKLVASCVGDQLTPSATSIGDAEANARLIAAAPELLAACEAALRYDQAILGRAARGEVDLLEGGSGVASGDDLDRLYFDWQEKSCAAVAKATQS